MARDLGEQNREDYALYKDDVRREGKAFFPRAMLHDTIMAFVVVRRRKELGLRLALGADPGNVLWMVMKEVVVLLGIGLAVGIPAAIGLGRFVSSQLYGIEPDDPFIAVSTVVLIAVVSATAGLIPARRASRIDPILALRYE